MEIIKFTQDYKSIWDDFVRNSKNGTFLLERSFMDYHSDRFQDHSLLIYNEKKDLQAILPANQKGKDIYSHGGLTYGSLILKTGAKLYDVIKAFFFVLKYFDEKGFCSLHYKTIPAFYHFTPSYEEQYLMFLLDAEIDRIDTSFTLELEKGYKFQKRRLRSIKKAQKLNVEIVKKDECASFWEEILTPNLQERFGVNPVHSLDEITKLKNNFPSRILQYNGYLDGKIEAGTTIFYSNGVAHAQYISASDEGRRLGVLDYLFSHLITNVFKNDKYFSFGISNENGGRSINKGLMDWKEGFDSKVYPNIFYNVNIKNYNQLEKFI